MRHVYYGPTNDTISHVCITSSSTTTATTITTPANAKSSCWSAFIKTAVCACVYVGVCVRSHNLARILFNFSSRHYYFCSFSQDVTIFKELNNIKLEYVLIFKAPKDLCVCRSIHISLSLLLYVCVIVLMLAIAIVIQFSIQT